MQAAACCIMTRAPGLQMLPPTLMSLSGPILGKFRICVTEEHHLAALCSPYVDGCPVCGSIFLVVCVSVLQDWIDLSVCLSVCPSVRPPVCLSVSVCLPVHPSVCLCVCLQTCMSVCSKFVVYVWRQKDVSCTCYPRLSCASLVSLVCCLWRLSSVPNKMLTFRGPQQ